MRVLILAASLAALSAQAGGPLRLSVADYRDRAAAAWVGQMAGVEWGMPTELRAKGRMLGEKEVPEWRGEWINRAFGNDDLFVEMTFLRTLEARGLGVTSREAGIDFANTTFGLCGANYTGRNNLRLGIAPPDCSHPSFNRCADDLDWQIEADFSGIISPGLPAEVVRLSRTFGPLVGYGDAVYGGAFVGAMYAAAFFRDDPEGIVREALKAIPTESRYAEMVRNVLKWHAESPDDWMSCWEKANAAYAMAPEVRRNGLNLTPGSTAISNGACVLIGLLYGGGDPDRTIVISMRCGWDSDCNPSNAAGILFASRGMKGVPAKFVSALDRTKRFNGSPYDFDGLLVVCERLARENVKRAGGRIEKGKDGREWMVIPRRPVSPGKAVSSWNPPPPEGSRYSAEERAKISRGAFAGPQKAIVDAVAAKQQLVTIPQGVFALEEPKDGAAFIVIRGVKNLRIVGSWAKYVCPSRKPFLEIVDCDNVIVEAMKIDYPGAENVDPGFPVRLIRSTNVKFDDVTCRGKHVAPGAAKEG